VIYALTPSKININTLIVFTCTFTSFYTDWALAGLQLYFIGLFTSHAIAFVGFMGSIHLHLLD
jgi:hypothetical protein